jgi:hypothetical protein
MDMNRLATTIFCDENPSLPEVKRPGGNEEDGNSNGFTKEKPDNESGSERHLV